MRPEVGVMSTTDSAPGPEDSTPPPLEVRLAIHEDAPDECTLAPTDAEGIELMSRWISAKADSFVALEDMR